MTATNTSSRKKEEKTVEKSTGVKEMLENPWNWVFLVFATCTLGGAIPFTKACFDITIS